MYKHPHFIKQTLAAGLLMLIASGLPLPAALAGSLPAQAQAKGQLAKLLQSSSWAPEVKKAAETLEFSGVV